MKLVTVNNIVLFRLFAHLTHLIQSLDVKIFKSYKHYYAEAIDSAVRIKNTKFEKLKFLTAFQTFRNQTFKLFTIRHAFKTTEIVSFNLNMILDIIRKKSIKISAFQIRTFSSSFSFQLIKTTSRGLKIIKQFERKLKQILKNVDSGENITITKMIDKFQRFVREIITSVDILNLIIRDLNIIQRVKTTRKIRFGLSDQVIAKERIIKISQCKKLCSICQKKKEKAKRKKQQKTKKTKSSIKKKSLLSLTIIGYLFIWALSLMISISK